MTWFSRLLARLGWRWEAPTAPAPIAPPQSADAAQPTPAVGDPEPLLAPWPQSKDLARILAELGAQDPEPWGAAFAVPCRTYAINTPQRLAPFLATVLHESAGLTRLVESLNYSPQGLRATWPSRFFEADAQRMGRTLGRPADQAAIAERAYGGRMGNRPEGAGDGWLYRGRGPMQHTGRAAYEEISRALGWPLAEVPALLQTKEGGAEAAAWFWASMGCNELADRDDVEGWRRRVNGGLNGIEDVRARYAKARALIG